MKKYYFNLTCGIEKLKDFDINNNFGFIRIQSTLCERHKFSKILLDLDYDFLLNLAIGNECIIYDYSAKKQVPRAFYQGIKFILYALNRYWFNKITNTFVKEFNCETYFDKVYAELNDEVFKKLKYFKKFLDINKNMKINIETISKNTKNDNNFEYYKKILNIIKE